MPFPLTAAWSADKFRTDIIDYYFPHLGSGTANQKLLREDYAMIGAFLTRTQDVLLELVELEKEIRVYLVNTAPSNVLVSVTGFKPSTGGTFKTHKVLTNVLSRLEIEQGFNNPEEFGVLHSKAMYATGTDTFTMDATGRPDVRVDPRDPTSNVVTKATPIPMPKGVPTVSGLNLHHMDFNRILLAHGYQFKDVGASKDHGEYTHRLQWHAIFRANAAGRLPLKKSPLEIYRSMGALAAKWSANTEPNLHLYIWEALFDNFRSKVAAETNYTVAHCTGAFNAPEVFNVRLSSGIDLGTLTFKQDDPSNLFCLRALLRSRYLKREATEGSSYWEKIVGTKGARNKAIASGESAGTFDKNSELRVALVWYLS